MHELAVNKAGQGISSLSLLHTYTGARFGCCSCCWLDNDDLVEGPLVLIGLPELTTLQSPLPGTKQVLAEVALWHRVNQSRRHGSCSAKAPIASSSWRGPSLARCGCPVDMQRSCSTKQYCYYDLYAFGSSPNAAGRSISGSGASRGSSWICLKEVVKAG